MDSQTTVEDLKECLRNDVAYLCHRVDRRWAEPIARTFRDLRESKAHAVFFGGTLRSLLLARMSPQRMTRIGRPRDIDIVFDGINLDDLRSQFSSMVSRETRFGGLQLKRSNMQFDVWPLNRTWSFVHDETPTPTFSDLPYTTFFNVEAIAVDVWAEPGSTRSIYSGDDQFFAGMLSRTIEINREDNPFPVLSVARSLIMASSLGFAIGPNLSRYLVTHGPSISSSEFETIQNKHYGQLRMAPDSMRELIVEIRRKVERGDVVPFKIPALRQQMLWPDKDGADLANAKH